VATATSEAFTPWTIPVTGASVVIAQRTLSGGVAVSGGWSVSVSVDEAGSVELGGGVGVDVAVEAAVAVVRGSASDPEHPATRPARAAPSVRSVALRDRRRGRDRHSERGLEDMASSDGLAARG
jgi:hypothetical protein